MNNVQENLKENITKVFEKLREEGKVGYCVKFHNIYPVEEKVNSLGRELIQIKNYREYMKLIQILERLIQMTRHENNPIELIDREDFDLEIEIIQNTMNHSFEMGFIDQYSCLVKCYDSLLRIRNELNYKKICVKLPQYTYTCDTEDNVRPTK